MTELIIIGGLVVIIFLLITTVSSKLNFLETRIKSLKFTLDQVTSHVDVPEHPINEKLRVLLKEGKEVQAVKEVRQAFGLSLLEAKQYVDGL
ncbi:hypothetical protein ACFFJI_04925 [Allobacillus sp. GCM10007491]|uniref:Ribosomal protein L7/L12 C-terminal domain-containing protein n=1 Tax=Allobacillus saliphilus TaxID=2912308 RepID=A0A941CVV4_9BACI|nr:MULTISPECIES: hypothetical protein [Allobacillus]MBR7554091.1 hypothetical protein [Allobacillus saliphilus]TSJ68017.1 hypothetical protein FPQ10_05560 [Allobacillus sp. SKP2-8]